MMLLPLAWPELDLDVTCKTYIYVIEVYVDDFCTMVQTSDVTQPQHISRAFLMAIHDVFPPPLVTRHSGGDPISNKKLLEGEGP